MTTRRWIESRLTRAALNRSVVPWSALEPQRGWPHGEATPRQSRIFRAGNHHGRERSPRGTTTATSARSLLRIDLMGLEALRRKFDGVKLTRNAKARKCARLWVGRHSVAVRVGNVVGAAPWGGYRR